MNSGKRRSLSTIKHLSEEHIFKFQFVKNTFRHFIHWGIAMALLPFLWSCLKNLFLMFPSFRFEKINSWWLFGCGMSAYFTIEHFLVKPMGLYVFGHEMTHVVSGVLSGAKIHSFKSSAKGGEVRLSKKNTFIALSPYIIPLYSITVLALYAVLKNWVFSPALIWSFQLLMGASLAFHLSMTFSAVHRKQPDLKFRGFFLSIVLIAIGNSLIFGLMMVGLFDHTPTLPKYLASILKETMHVWRLLWKFSITLIHQIPHIFQTIKEIH